MTVDGLLRGVAAEDGRRVHGVLWVIDELKRSAICGDEILVAALECWRDDPTVRLQERQLMQGLALLEPDWLPDDALREWPLPVVLRSTCRIAA